ncbi:MAG: hypothetical protein IT458_03345 [Planctomycetes bacterium]|nr:hypothetical protein [Planctomycetota bacterium]
MNTRVLPLLLLTLLSGCAGSAGSRERAVLDRPTVLARARAALSERHFDQALAQTDLLLAADPRDKDALLVAAEANLGMADTARSGQMPLLEDAYATAKRAVDVDRSDGRGWHLVAEAEYRRNNFAASRDAALSAARLFAERGDRASAAAAFLSAAQGEMQLFVASRRAELEDAQPGGSAPPRPGPDTLELAAKVFGHLGQARANGAVGASAVRAAQVHQWLGRNTEAIAELERALELAAEDAELHTAYQEAFFQLDKRAECVAAYRRMGRERPQSRATQWFLGRALVAQADAERQRGATSDATEHYREAAQVFGEYGATVPDHAQAAADWVAICQLALGRVAVDGGNLAGAKEWFAKAYATTPRVAEYPDGQPLLYDSFGGHYARGLDLIGQASTASGTREGMEAALAHYREVVQRHPDRFGAMFNNAALTARDLGVAYARDGRDESAKALWEESYRYYCKAVELEPQDARIVNDCGLMLVYHLHREYGRARELFDRAIQLGTAQLAELPEDAPQEQRNGLEEAVGDAWQNIAVLMRNLGRPFAEYREYCEKAVKYYPYERREAARLLRGGAESAPASTRRAAPVGTPGTPGGWIVAPPRFAPPASGRPGQDQDGGKAAAFAKVKQAADTKAAAEDYDGALLVLDRAAAELRGYAPFHHLSGIMNLRHAVRSRDAGGKAGLVDGLFADAVNQLKRAVELDAEPAQYRVDLMQAQLERGDFADAARTAKEALSLARSQGGGDPVLLAALHAGRADANTRVYVAARQEGKDAPEALQAARESYREVEKAGPLPARVFATWLSLEQWAGAGDAALELAMRVLAREPGRDDALNQLVDLAVAARKPEKAIALLTGRSDAKSLWYLGRARFSQALDQWSANPREPKEALAAIAQAQKDFAASKAGNAEYADSCDQWLALCLTAQGFMHLSADQTPEAEASFLAAVRLRPDKIAAEIGPNQSARIGVLTVGGKYFERDPARMEALFRAAHEAASEDFDFASNFGLAARDHGTLLERQRKTEAARQMYEASYRAYRKAAQLDPDNLRLKVDLAILPIYHLGVDLDETRDLLLAVAETGERRLQEMKPGDSDRKDLNETVADAWQNLGQYYLAHAKDAAKARAALEKSLKFLQRGPVQAMLRRAQQMEKTAQSQPESRPGDGKQ